MILWQWRRHHGALMIILLAMSLFLLGAAIKVTLAQEGEGEPVPAPTTAVDGAPELASPSAADLSFQRQTPMTMNAYRDVPYAPGELLVGFYNGDTQALQRALPEVSAAALTQELDLRGLSSAMDGPSDGGIKGYVLQVPDGSEWATMEQLLQDPTVAFAEPNWLVFAANENTEDIADDAAEEAMLAVPEAPFTVNDPFYVDAPEDYPADQWYLQRINSSRAWALSYADDGFGGGFVEVHVAVIDSGIDVNHPEFRGRLSAGYNYINPALPPDDDYGHGTHVAGLIGAVANNAAGIAGVAPKVRIDARKVLNQQGSGKISDVAAAIREATDDGADIINLSLESSAPNVTMEAAAQYAFNRGVLLIAAAGNFYPKPVSWPAAYDEVMAIGATTYNDTHASYSNAGPEVEIAAPGGERNRSVVSTWPAGVRCRDINAAPAQSDYCTSEGTSMAAAIASGGAALIKSLRPSLSAAEIRQLLQDTAYPLDEPATFVGEGRLDLQNALRTILPPHLQLSTNTFVRSVDLETDPYTVTLRLDNPSATPLAWEADLISGQGFITFHNAISGTLSGTVQFGEPVYLSLTISPTNLITGGHGATLQLDEVQANNTRRSYFVDMTVLVNPPQNLQRTYLPLIQQGAPQQVADTAYRWEVPAASADRTIHGMTDNSNVAVTLPFTYTLRGQSYTSARIYSDGLLRLPNTSAGSIVPNQCLPNLAEPAQAIYGWWADLNPAASGGRVSSFPAGTDRFVIEFDNVASSNSVSPAYRVSFQMVLYANGDIRLNYRDALAITADAPNVTVGVEARDGRFFNQVACNTNSVTVGYLPESNQSIFFDADGDIY